MKDIEKTMEALIKYVLAENPKTQKRAREELICFLNGEKPASTDPETVVRQFLMKIGTPEHLVGYPYIVKAILITIEDRDFVDNLYYRLYPTVATLCDSTPSKVERAIRRVIEVTWDRGDLNALEQYFGTMGTKNGRPNNGEFLARVSNIIKMEMRESA